VESQPTYQMHEYTSHGLDMALHSHRAQERSPWSDSVLRTAVVRAEDGDSHSGRARPVDLTFD